MPKNYAKNAEDRSIFLVPSNSDSDVVRKGERTDTSPIRAARMIDINRIQPRGSVCTHNHLRPAATPLLMK